jgi:hypothetical protein
MSIEQSLYELTVAVNKLTMTIEKSNQEPVIKMASEIIMEPEEVPTIKPVKLKPTPIVTADKTVTNIVDQPAVALDVLEMRDAIRTMCSEMVQSDQKSKTGVKDIFAKYKATHLKRVDDTHIPSLYDSLTVFKGKLK